MGYGLTVLEGPAQEPVTVDEVMQRARIDALHEVQYLAGRISAARERIEATLQRALITQTLRLTLDRFPFNEHQGAPAPPAILLPRSPAQSISEIRYVDTAGELQVLPADAYRFDGASIVGRITPAWGHVWPVTLEVTNAVEVDFVAGYGDAPDDVPAPIRDAIAVLVATWHGPGRMAYVTGSIATPLPMSVDYLLGPYRVGSYPGGD